MLSCAVSRKPTLISNALPTVSANGNLSSVKKVSGSSGFAVDTAAELNSQKLIGSAAMSDYTASGHLSSVRKITGNTTATIETTAHVSSSKRLIASESFAINAAMAIIYYHQFLLHEGDVVIDQTSGSVRQLDLNHLLPQGLWTLGLSYVDQYGSESPQAMIEVEFDADGHVVSQLREIDTIEAAALAGGYIALIITLEDKQAWHRNPMGFEVFDTSSQMVIGTIAASGNGAYITEATAGPFTHGLTKRLKVRPYDATGYGVWSNVPSVVVDSEGPVAPVVVW